MLNLIDLMSARPMPPIKHGRIVRGYAMGNPKNTEGTPTKVDPKVARANKRVEANQHKRAALVSDVLASLPTDKRLSVTDILKLVPYSKAGVQSALNELYGEGKVKRTSRKTANGVGVYYWSRKGGL